MLMIKKSTLRSPSENQVYASLFINNNYFVNINYCYGYFSIRHSTNKCDEYFQETYYTHTFKVGCKYIKKRYVYIDTDFKYCKNNKC